MDEKQMRELARTRASFKVHLSVYLTLMVVLAIINLLTTRYLWFLYPVVGWGVGVVFHYLSAYVFDPNAVEREYQKIKATQKKR